VCICVYAHTHTHTHTQYGCCTIMNYDTGIVCALTSFFWFVLMPYQPAAQSLRARVRVREMLHLSQALPNVMSTWLLSLCLSLSRVCVFVCVCIHARASTLTLHTRAHILYHNVLYTHKRCARRIGICLSYLALDSQFTPVCMVTQCSPSFPNTDRRSGGHVRRCRTKVVSSIRAFL